MKIYMVEASWYDDLYEESECGNIAAFTSKESAQKYIDTFPFDEYIDFNGVPYNEVNFWISEYELKD